ncbi:MAG TPA: PP2C family protein-serine/threonine phosphatase [Herpetosiphonaceae bacterium]
MPDALLAPATIAALNAPLDYAGARRLLRPLVIPCLIFCALLAVLTLNVDPAPMSFATVFWNLWESFGTGMGTLGCFALLAPVGSKLLLRLGWAVPWVRIALGLVALLLAQLAVNATVVLLAPPERGESTWIELLLNWLVLGAVTTVVFALVERAQIELRKGREAVRRNALLDRELALAQEIQANLIPPPPAVPGLELASGYYAAREVGGDLLGYQALPGGALGLAIGDVTGKSVPAAMLMGVTLGAHQAAQRARLSPAAVLDELDSLLRAQAGGRRFVALCSAIVDPAARRMLVANAGQLDPILCRAGAARFVELPSAMPLGIGPPAASQEREIALEPGDALIFYTDGIVEAHNQAGELFGFERLLALADSLEPGAGAAAIHQSIIAAVRAFAGGAEPHDDISLLVVRLAPTG